MDSKFTVPVFEFDIHSYTVVHSLTVVRRLRKTKSQRFCKYFLVCTLWYTYLLFPRYENQSLSVWRTVKKLNYAENVT